MRGWDHLMPLPAALRPRRSNHNIGRKAFAFWLACLILGILALSACSTPLVTACPPVKSYTQEFQNRLADELAALPPDAALGQAMVDYGQLRAQLRACAKPV